MLIRPPDEPGTENQEARQRYEVMQCFTVSQPKSFKEEGEGRAEPSPPALQMGRGWGEGGPSEILQDFHQKAGKLTFGKGFHDSPEAAFGTACNQC